MREIEVKLFKSDIPALNEILNKTGLGIPFDSSITNVYLQDSLYEIRFISNGNIGQVFMIVDDIKKIIRNRRLNKLLNS